MPLAGRAYLAFTAIVLTTMATRVGWIDWYSIFTVTATLAVGALGVLILAALLIGLPSFALITLFNWLLKPASASPTGGGQRHVQ